MLIVKKENITFSVKFAMALFLFKLAFKTMFSETLGFQMFADYAQAETNRHKKKTVVEAIAKESESRKVLLVE